LLLAVLWMCQFDHLEFQGVVPRTFLGPLLLAGLCAPAKYVLQAMGVHKEIMLQVCRGMLGILFLLSFSFLRRCVASKFASDANSQRRLSNTIALVSCCQFHLLFYCSRPLANTLASVCTNVALGYWVRSSSAVDDRSRYSAGGRCVMWLAVACIFFRCDMALLSVCVIAASLLYRWISLRPLLQYGALTSMVAILISVLVDSFFWRRWVWPEFEVFLFNARPNAEGQMFKAADAWGTEPFLWYFSKAIPKAMLGSLLLLPVALLQRIPRRWAELMTDPASLLRIDWRVMQLVSGRTVTANCVIRLLVALSHSSLLLSIFRSVVPSSALCILVLFPAAQGTALHLPHSAIAGVPCWCGFVEDQRVIAVEGERGTRN
jgi:hypothetical protein